MTTRVGHQTRPLFWVILVGLIVILANGVVFAYILYFQNMVAVITLDNLILPPNIVVCPGDTINYSYQLHVSKRANVNVATSVEPAGSAYHTFTPQQQFIFDGPVDFTRVLHYKVPPSFVNPLTGDSQMWQPGKYVQRVHANIEGMTTATELLVPFEIMPLEGCTP